MWQRDFNSIQIYCLFVTFLFYILKFEYSIEVYLLHIFLILKQKQIILKLKYFLLYYSTVDNVSSQDGSLDT